MALAKTPAKAIQLLSEAKATQRQKNIKQRTGIQEQKPEFDEIEKDERT